MVMRRSLAWIFFIMTGIGWGGFTIGEVLEKYYHFIGCKLCHVERWFLLIGGVSCFLTWIWWSKPFGRLSAWTSLSLWMIGSGVAWYHVGIQYHVFPLPFFCSVQEADSLQQFLSLPSVTCDQRTLEIFSLPASLYLAILFLGCGLACGYGLSQRKETL